MDNFESLNVYHKLLCLQELCKKLPEVKKFNKNIKRFIRGNDKKQACIQCGGTGKVNKKFVKSGVCVRCDGERKSHMKASEAVKSADMVIAIMATYAQRLFAWDIKSEKDFDEFRNKIIDVLAESN